MLVDSDRGSLTLHREVIDVGQMLEELKDRSGHQAAFGEGAILIRAPHDMRMWADPLRLRQALGNLIDNALRHGGRTVVVRAERAAGSVILQVSDDGPRVPPQFLAAAVQRV